MGGIPWALGPKNADTRKDVPTAVRAVAADGDTASCARRERGVAIVGSQRACHVSVPPLSCTLGCDDGSARHKITPERLVRDFCAREAAFFG